MKRIVYMAALWLLPSAVVAQDFEDNPHIDVARALFGRIAGLNVSAGTGDSWDNCCSLALHGRTPLVLVDGFPRDIRHLTSLEVEKVEVLTDAASCALYGVRGGNGVVLVTTKRAAPGRLKVGVNYQYGLETQWRAPEFADAVLYAGTLNAALVGDGLEPRYSDAEIDAFRTGRYPYAYPDVDWWKEVYRDVAGNHRVNMTFEGGSGRFRYYTVADYMNQTGFFKETTTDDRYRTGNTDVRMNLRTNLDVALTKTTDMKLGLLAKFGEYSSARYGDIYEVLYCLPSAAFPVRHRNGMYGGSSLWPGKNPVALLMDTGSQKSILGAMNADMTLTQRLDALAEGLTASLSVAFDDIGTMTESVSKSFMYREMIPTITEDGTLVTSRADYGDGSKVLGHSSGFQSLCMRFDGNGKVAWNRTSGKHAVSVAELFDMQSYTVNGRNKSTRRLSAISEAAYTYDGRYTVGAVAAWSGTAYLAPGHKMKFYPALRASWTASSEKFLKGVRQLDRLELEASFGWSGWDGNLTHELYLPSWGGTGAVGYYFSDGTYSYGVREGTLPVESVTPEKVMRATGALVAGAFGGRLGFRADGFYERVGDILINASPVVSGVIGASPGMQCAGINDWMGADGSLSWEDGKGDFSYGAYANVSWLTSKVVQDGQEWQRYDYLYHKGHPVGQRYGLVAEGFFRDNKDINNTVEHTFSTVRPGDVKYVDQNGDFKVTEEDVVPIGKSSIPEWYFGFGFHAGYKGFRLSAGFQGRAGVTVNMLDSPLYKPLVDNSTLSRTFLDMEIPWTQQTVETATVPRLTTLANANNYRNSSIWYRDGSFLKLRDVTLAYTLPGNWFRFGSVELWVKGTDLFSLDHLGKIDPECLGASYPSLRTWWAGIRFKF